MRGADQARRTTAYVSMFDLFSIGVGPSSSHTVGPMRAARAFARGLRADGLLPHVDRVTCVLYGSLGSTGLGHGTPDAVVAGLSDLDPATCDPDRVRGAWSRRPPDGAPGDSAPDGLLRLAGERPVPFPREAVAFAPRTRLPGHPNALTLLAWRDGEPLPVREETWYSVGGGFVVREGAQPDDDAAARPVPYPFDTAAELLATCAETGLDIAGVARANEDALHGSEAVAARLDAVWEAMASCVERGLVATGTLPGGLRVPRRAAAVRAHLEERDARGEGGTSTEWLHAWALAVNEENASGGRVVTAPTNGAAGIVPSVAHHYVRFVPGASREGIHRFLLTAAALGSLFKRNASISGAEGGCQAEVGSACAMAAGALCAVRGGTPGQVENAAEIAIEHHLGLTCDPVGGLVQIPCIERNAIAASTAVSAALLALHGDGTHLVSLDTVVETMRQTGRDMSSKYKETSEGGLAVNVVEC
ncbi:serine dehydratase [Actinotalea ferrariae CF5-4]|uniref:L-serine dehydratase n=1 Tax=Actinotalea ferrariae CF5-4 TaxID=948458 RepID=A0A021VMF1_9CELL|nr:L-serine ammonia-lyase [Actinotalea ferrariae]EYR62341.1 serine dehydratase [Actinotalea ferrariae CF5-4]